MKHFSRSLLAGISFVFILIGVWALFSYDYPQLKEIIRSLEERRLLKNKFQDEKEKLEKVQKIFDSYHSFLPAKEKVSLLLPEEKEFGDVLYQLKGMADLSNVKLNRCTFGEVRKEKRLPRFSKKKEKLTKDFGTLSAALEVEGDYPSIKSFLKKVETNIRVMDIRKINLNKSGENLKGTITINFYYQLN